MRAQKEAGARRCQYFFFALEALRVKCAREAKEQMSKGEAQKCLHSKGVFAHKKGAHKDNHAPDRHRPALVLAPLSLCALRIRSDMLGLAMASIHRCPSPVLCPTLLLLHDGWPRRQVVSFEECLLGGLEGQLPKIAAADRRSKWYARRELGVWWLPEIVPS